MLYLRDILAQYFPIKSGDYVLEAKDFFIDESQLDKVEDFEHQKSLKFTERSLTVPLYAHLVLYYKGKKIDENPKVLIANLPVKLPRGTYIYGGNEYFFMNQLRLKPGVYGRIKENAEVEVQFNLAKWGFRLFESDGVLYAKFTKGPRIPIYTLYKVLGGDDNAFDKAFPSKELAEKNRVLNYNAIVGWYEAYYDKTDEKEAIETMRKVLTSGYRFDESVMKAIFGRPYQNVTPELILDAIKRYFMIRRGESMPDDRDSLIFKDFYSEEDVLRDHFLDDSYMNNILRKIRRNMQTAQTIDDLKLASIFQREIDRVFEMELVSPLKQTNPVTIADNLFRTTIFGEGGIKSEYAVTEWARSLNPTHFSFMDPLRTPEGDKVGAVLFQAIGTKKEGTTLKTQVLDAKTGKSVYISPAEFFDSYVALPDQYDVEDGVIKFKDKNKVKAMYRGEIVTVPANKIQYLKIAPVLSFTVTTNLLPFISSMSPARAARAANVITQALPLKDAEAPLVQTSAGDKSFEQLYGENYSIRAPVDGEVVKVTDTQVVIKDSKGKKHTIGLVNYLPLNNRSFLTFTPVVRVGDKVKAGDLIADTNFTDKGVLAIGKNLLTAFLPYKMLNFEDGIVISESAAKKLTSRQLHLLKFTIGPDVIIDKNRYRALYPQELLQNRYDKLDEEGVIKEGETVEEGDILVAGLIRKTPGPVDVVIGKLGRKYVREWTKFPLVWDRAYPGKVIEVKKTRNLISISILTEEPAVVGDKLSNRHYAKGIITAIIPDEEMPKTEDGRTIDVLVNPVNIIGRANPSQVYETIAAKAAEKLGQPVVVENFGRNNYEFVKELMEKTGVRDTERIYDPKTGKWIEGVLVGPHYFMKLEHQVEDKLSARYKGSYDWDLLPAKGGEDPSKALDLLTTYSLLSHGAKANLYEMAVWKGQKNPVFWEAIENNTIIPPPKPPFVFDKLVGMMQSMGIDVHKSGSVFKLFSLTRDKIEELVGDREIKNARMIVAGTLKEEKGGLFDPETLGGLSGEKWGYIRLPFQVTHPVLIGMIATLLNMKSEDVEQVLYGKKMLGGKTGAEALLSALNSLDLDAILREYTEMASNSTDLDVLRKANRVIRFIRAMKEANVKFEDFFFDKLPVMPPKYRPIYVSPDNKLFTNDFNLLYRDVKLAVDAYNQAKEAGLTESRLATMGKKIWENIKILHGLADPSSNYYGKRKPRGIIEFIAGTSPKEGFYQAKLLHKEQDLVGRSIIVPDPGLHPDEVGIPEEMAWKIFQPFIMSKLRSLGYSPVEAFMHIKNQTDVARRALEAVMNERTVLLNRAPSLHKYNIMAFKPKLVAGKALKIPPLVVTMFNADFDGDAMTVHVPVTLEALQESYKLFPSVNYLHEAKKNIQLMPRMEAVIGLYNITRTGKRTDKSFANLKEAMEAYHRGEIDITDVIRIGNRTTTLGRALVNEILPEEYRDYNIELDKKNLQSLLANLFNKDVRLGADVAYKLNKLGGDFAYLTGVSVSLKDLEPAVNDVLEQYAKKLEGKPPEYINKQVSQLRQDLLNALTRRDNIFVKLVQSGARGDKTQLLQLLASPLQVEDVYGRPIPKFIKSGYNVGLSYEDYLLAAYGGRKGMIEKRVQTGKPGELNKEMIAAAADYVITMRDCGTHAGIIMPLERADLEDRALAEDVYKGSKLIAKRNEILEGEVVDRLRAAGITEVKVRTPLTCEAPEGICAYCYGYNDKKRLPDIGEYVGIKAAQYIAEPMTQLALSSIHTGGVVRDVAADFDDIRAVLEMRNVLPNRATIATVSGKVDKVERRPEGGYRIVVNGVEHVTSPWVEPIVKEGDRVTAGDMLTTGTPHPKDVYNVQGIDAAKQFIVDYLNKAYESNGIKIDPRQFEVLSKVMFDTAVVIDPGDLNYAPGDYVKLNKLLAENRNLPTAIELAVDDARGRRLAVKTGRFPKDTELTDDVIRELKGQGIRVVKVYSKPATYNIVLKGVDQIGLLREDWMARMAYRDIKNTLQEGVLRAWASDVKGWNPIPRFVYGVTMKD